MNWIDTPESSNMTGFGYDPSTKVLTVGFKGGGRYDYAAVPVSVFEAMKKSESKGKFHSSFIRNNFKHTKQGEKDGKQAARKG